MHRLELLVHLILLPLIAGFASPATSGQDSLANHPDLRLALARSQRTIKADRDEFSGEQPGRFAFRANSVGRVTVADVAVRTVAFGNGDSSVLAAKPTASLGKDKTGFSKLSFDRPGFSEWYVNEAAGLHHWFRIDKKQGPGNLWVKLATTGAKPKQTGPDRIEFNGAKDNLSYSGLKVWDATGKKLASTMQLRGQEIVIGVEDQDAKYPVTIDPTWTEEAILTPAEDPNIQRLYAGDSVSISGDTAVIGARYSDVNGLANAGSAYVFTRNGSSWTQQATLIASDPERYASFGRSVSIDGDVIAIGSPSSTANSGKVYVFSKSGSTWTQTDSFTGADVQNGFGFGTSVKLAGRSLFAGAPWAPIDGQDYAGKVYEFAATEAGWEEQGQIISPNAQYYGQFGITMDASGSNLIVGASTEGTAEAEYHGNAYVFSRGESGWESQTLAPSVSGNHFGLGHFVTISGDTACVTARNSSGAYDGKVFVFRREGGAWIEKAILSSPEPQSNSHFGESVAILNDSIIVGQAYFSDILTPNYLSGGVHIFAPDGSGWSHSSSLLPSDLSIYGSDYIAFGRALSASGDSFIVGANYKDRYKGSAYVYRMEAAASVLANVSFPTLGIAGGKSVTGTVTLASAATSTLSVNLASNSGSLTVPASVTIPTGSTSATFTAMSSLVTSDTLVTVTTSGDGITSGSGQITVRTPRVSSVSFGSDAVTVGETAIGTVTLQSAAPTGGLLVTLVNSDSTGLDCPATVTVPSGQTKTTFAVTGKSVASPTLVKVEGTPSFNEKSDTITVNPSSIYITELYTSDFILGTFTFGTVRLSSPAPAGGYVVTLDSLTTGLSVPASATVPEGQTFTNFAVNSTRALQNGTIRATFQGSIKTDLVSVTYNAITTVTASATSITVGQDSMVTVTLNAAVPLGARLVVDVTSQKAGVLSLPSTKLTGISGGSSSVTFPVTGLKAGVTNLYVKILNHGVKAVKITVN